MEEKNILYFTRTMDIGGTEKVIMQLCRYFNNKFNKIVVCSIGGIHEVELYKLGIKHYKINDIENKNPINIIKTFINVFKIINRENINIVHTHHRMAAFYSSILKKIFKFKFINTAHNTFNDKILFTKLALKNADIVSVGKKVKENLIDVYKLNPNQITVIYNGIEKNNEPIIEIPELKKYKDDGYFLVGNIGRLSEQKGMEYYINAIPDVLKRYPRVMFYIIGDGEDKMELINLAKELRIENNLIFLGFRNDVINVIKQLDLIVLSSLWEGLPLTPIESFSQKKSVIATDVDGTPEIIKNGYNGILITPRNNKVITEKVIELAKNNDLRVTLENNALKTYRENFTQEIFIKRYEWFYNNTI